VCAGGLLASGSDDKTIILWRQKEAQTAQKVKYDVPRVRVRVRVRVRPSSSGDRRRLRPPRR
jgi:hypothetical protein